MMDVPRNMIQCLLFCPERKRKKEEKKEEDTTNHIVG